MNTNRHTHTHKYVHKYKLIALCVLIRQETMLSLCHFYMAGKRCLKEKDKAVPGSLKRILMLGKTEGKRRRGE